MSQQQHPMLSARGSVAAAAPTTIITGVANKRIRVCSITLTMNSSTVTLVKLGDTGSELWRASLVAPANSTAGVAIAVPYPAHLFNTTVVGSDLQMNNDTGQTIHYSIGYFFDD